MKRGSNMPYYLSSRTEKIDMNIKPKDKTIKELLLSEHQFVIPRFQREYSWERKHYKEFLEDTLDGLIINSGTIANNPYFLGTMLFVGDCFENEQEEIVVVDGYLYSVYESAALSNHVRLRKRRPNESLMRLRR